ATSPAWNVQGRCSLPAFRLWLCGDGPRNGATRLRWAATRRSRTTTMCRILLTMCGSDLLQRALACWKTSPWNDSASGRGFGTHRARGGLPEGAIGRAQLRNLVAPLELVLHAPAAIGA